MNQIQAAKKWRVQANTSSYGICLPGRRDFPEAISEEFLPFKKFEKPEVFSERGAHLDAQFSDFIKQNIVRNFENNEFQVQIIILGKCVGENKNFYS